MSRTRWIFSILLALLATPVAGQTTLPSESVHWGQTVSNLRLGIAIRPLSRAEFHPGEIARIYVAIQGDKPLVLPRAIAMQMVDLHLLTPDGHEYILGGWGKDRISQLTADDWEYVHDRFPDERPIRLTFDQTSWSDAATRQIASFSMRNSGIYRLWAQADLQPLPGAPNNAWAGHVASAQATFKVSDLPPENRQQKLTAEQSDVLNAWLSGKDQWSDAGGRQIQIEDWLTSQMEWTQSEALAQRMLQIAKDAGPYSPGALKFLSSRSGRGDSPGIDGPYLNSLVKWDLDQLQNPNPDSANWNVDDAVWACLALHPEDDSLKHRVIEIARKSALSDRQWSIPHTTKPASERPPISIPAAWDILLRFNLLKSGMTASQATELLGPARTQTPDQLVWYLGDHPHYGSELHATLQDGKIIQWNQESWPTDTGG